MTTRKVIIIEDEMVIGAILDHFIEYRCAGHGRRAWQVVIERLSERYGAKIVKAAEQLYARELRRERQALQRQNRQARAWLRRQKQDAVR
jgi:hypothetical protein